MREKEVNIKNAERQNEVSVEDNVLRKELKAVIVIQRAWIKHAKRLLSAKLKMDKNTLENKKVSVDTETQVNTENA